MDPNSIRISCYVLRSSFICRAGSLDEENQNKVLQVMTFITTVLMFAAALINFPTHANSVKLKWSFHKQFHCLAFILHLIDLVCAVPFSIILPNAYSALDGDLYIQVLQNNSALSSDSRYLNLFRLNDSEKHFIKRIKLAPDIQRQNITHITVGCHYFLYGGKYQVQIVDETDDINSTQELNSFKNFEVAWPALKMNISSNLTPTYPDEPVQVELTFAAGKCRRRNFAKADRPEYWLEVLYCGQDSTCSTNKTNTHMLYTEQVKHFQSKNLFNLSCDLFGFAGQYAIQLRPISPLKTILAQTFVHADWNDKFVFNVRERSVFPCDPHIGIGVLFEYPSCIENQIRDRIRIFGRLRADIASLKPPTTLEYVTERRIEENKHSMYFECDLFSERFVEYCFTYVTQAIFGAVAEIRVDCVPTLPISDTDSGGWGPWSDWTPCSTTCSGGKRHRYRFCDSPPPRYGAKFCQNINLVNFGNDF
ncbi:unnamed protein product [Hermetia illucens]|uniref:Uncharacterized protein n=1 Tax=Hermetia illucens TaxID=343691 RepID=A0A7R8UKB4_HERIL|nr:unnamed protein product [Hermetia illucens]